MRAECRQLQSADTCLHEQVSFVCTPPTMSQKKAHSKKCDDWRCSPALLLILLPAGSRQAPERAHPQAPAPRLSLHTTGLETVPLASPVPLPADPRRPRRPLPTQRDCLIVPLSWQSADALGRYIRDTMIAFWPFALKLSSALPTIPALTCSHMLITRGALTILVIKARCLICIPMICCLNESLGRAAAGRSALQPSFNGIERRALHDTRAEWPSRAPDCSSMYSYILVHIRPSSLHSRSMGPVFERARRCTPRETATGN